MKLLKLIVLTIILNSCGKKCKVCTLEKNGVSTTKENCAYGGGSSNKSLETWEAYLKEDTSYTSVVCKMK